MLTVCLFYPPGFLSPWVPVGFTSKVSAEKCQIRLEFGLLSSAIFERTSRFHLPPGWTPSWYPPPTQGGLARHFLPRDPSPVAVLKQTPGHGGDFAETLPRRPDDAVHPAEYSLEGGTLVQLMRMGRKLFFYFGRSSSGSSRRRRLQDLERVLHHGSG